MNASAITIGVPVIATTFSDLWSVVIINTVNRIDQGRIMSRSSYMASEMSSRTLVSPVTVITVISESGRLSTTLSKCANNSSKLLKSSMTSKFWFIPTIIAVVSQIPSLFVSLISVSKLPFDCSIIVSILSCSGMAYSPPPGRFEHHSSSTRSILVATPCSHIELLNLPSAELISLITCAGEIIQRTPSFSPWSSLS